MADKRKMKAVKAWALIHKYDDMPDLQHGVFNARQHARDTTTEWHPRDRAWYRIARVEIREVK